MSRISKKEGWLCSSCKEVFKTRKMLQAHHKECKLWLKRGGHNQYIRAKELGIEVPEEQRSHFPSWLGRVHTEESKRKISESMKKAHAEGRAHNIGECRWNNKPSYPEQWFMKVLLNEFGMELGKDYEREVPFHKFSLDFAWKDKKNCVEIDGEQHERFKEQKRRDEEKDLLLKEEGWLEIRKPWKEIFNEPKKFIEEVRNILLEQ